MNIIFCFLLISSLPALIDGSYLATLVEQDIERLLDKDGNLIDSSRGKLVFSNDKRLGATESALVREGTYNGIKVAIKITWEHDHFDRELKAYNALNAIKNKEIEKYGIPCIYYHGTIIERYNAFAMTLFDGTLEDRYQTQGKNLSELTVTLIMKQAVQTLTYLAHKNVLHNDIKPENIFLRNAEVFIGDFGLATLNNKQCAGKTMMFASSSIYARRERYAVDDLESLVYSIWYVAGVPMDKSLINDSLEPEGFIMWQSEQRGEARQKMAQKCSHFKDLAVRHTFELICIEEIVSREKVPRYEKIISQLTSTISAVNKNSEEAKFEWLNVPPARRSSLFSRIFSKFVRKKRCQVIDPTTWE